MTAEEIIEIILKLASVAFFVFMNGFFVASEFALVKARETQLDTLIAKGDRRAKVAKKAIQNLDSSLSACQLGITIASLALGWIGEPVFTVILKPFFSLFSITSPQTKETLAIVFGFMTISYLHIIAGEQAAKWIGILKPLQTLLWISVPLRLFYFLTYPFTWLLNESVLKLLKLIGFDNILHQERTYSVEELRLLFASAVRKAGDRLSFGHEIVLNAIDLRNRIVRDVMTPRKEIVFLSTDMGIDKCMEIAESTRYSRFPLVENEDIDKTLGVIHIKDLYQIRKTAMFGRDLIPFAKKLIYVPPTARIEKVLRLFLERRLHMAIVVDEFGGTIGLITLENALEEIVGQIQDEFDQEKQSINKIGEDVWEILGTTPLYELSEIIKQPLNVEGISTISGWVTHYLGGFPKTGDTIQLGDYKLMVQSMNGALVDKIKLWKEKPSSENASNDK